MSVAARKRIRMLRRLVGQQPGKPRHNDTTGIKIVDLLPVINNNLISIHNPHESVSLQIDFIRGVFCTFMVNGDHSVVVHGVADFITNPIRCLSIRVMYRAEAGIKPAPPDL
jgi:hypothetical protein